MVMTIREGSGISFPRAGALMHTLAWVKGEPVPKDRPSQEARIRRKMSHRERTLAQ